MIYLHCESACERECAVVRFTSLPEAGFCQTIRSLERESQMTTPEPHDREQRASIWSGQGNIWEHAGLVLFLFSEKERERERER